MDALLAPLGVSMGELTGLVGLAIVLFLGLALLRGLLRLTARLLRFGCSFIFAVMLLAVLFVMLN